MEKALLALLMVGHAIRLFIIIFNCYGNIIIKNNDEYMILVYMRFANMALSILIVAFNIWLLYIFIKTFKFLFNLI